MLEINNLVTKFKVGEQVVTALDNVSLTVEPNTMVGLVGESGSGKSVTALSTMGLLPPNGFVESGTINWKNKNILDYDEKQKRTIRGSEIGLIFQNPLAALNPVYTIGNQMIETIVLHQKKSKEDARKIAIDLLKKVNISDPEKRIDDYPHQFSIGMCQRIMIAMTLSMKPELLIADEPTASLDVTIQAQILFLLKELKKEYEMSVLMISHDLGVISQYCDKVIVMYLGKIVEYGTPMDIFKNAKHPYTQALIQSIPSTDPTKGVSSPVLSEEMPSVLNLPKGCRFNTRCPKVMPECYENTPDLVGNDHAKSACFLYH